MNFIWQLTKLMLYRSAFLTLVLCVEQAQSVISPKEVHSINFDPSCPYQLAFHLDDGWYVKNELHLFHVHIIAVRIFLW